MQKTRDSAFFSSSQMVTFSANLLFIALWASRKLILNMTIFAKHESNPIFLNLNSKVTNKASLTSKSRTCLLNHFQSL